MTSLTESIAATLARELGALRREIEAYADEADLWRLPPGAANSGGTLALHIAGNLRHYVGARLGGSAYVRDRDAEFARRDVPRAELLAELEAAARDVERVLPALDASTLDAPFPERVGEWTLCTRDFLVHLATHLAYHVGQVDYHRRLVTGDARGVGAIAVRELASAHREVG